MSVVRTLFKYYTYKLNSYLFRQIYKQNDDNNIVPT